MTQLQIRELVVKTARAWLGDRESDGSFRHIIDLYNTHRPLPRGYALKYTDEWCAGMVSAVAIALGLTDIMPVECSCNNMIALYKNHTLSDWQEDESVTPEIGDVIFYDWQDSGAGDNRGVSDHVGIVSHVDGRNITVIEGNYDRSVKERKLTVNGRYIRGYAVPAYYIKADKEDEDVTRAELMTTAGTGDNPSGWAVQATDYCKRKGIFIGDGTGNFGWQVPLTREAAAQIIYNTLKAAGMLEAIPNARE